MAKPLKTDPAVKGLTPLKSIANKAKIRGEEVPFHIEHPEFGDNFRKEDLATPLGFSLPEKLNISEINEAIQDYGSIDNIDVEDFKAKRQSIFEQVAKGVGGLVANALLDSVGLVGVVAGLGETLTDLATGNFNSLWDLTNNFTGDKNEILAWNNELSRAVQEKLQIYKTREERGEVAPLTLGTFMDAVAQVGHAVPSIALAMASANPAALVASGIFTGLNEAQMEASATRHEINTTRDNTNYNTLLDSIRAKQEILDSNMRDFDSQFLERDYYNRELGLIDPNDKRSAQERLYEARANRAWELAERPDIKRDLDIVDASSKDLIDKTNQAYSKFTDQAVGTQFLVEGTILSMADIAMQGMYGKIVNRGGNFLTKNKIAKRLIGDKIAKNIENSLAKKLVSNSVEEITEETFEGLTKTSAIKKFGTRLGKIASPMLNEATQEMVQEGISQGAQGYVDNMINQYMNGQYDFDKISTWQGISQALEDGAKGTVSVEGLQQGFVAALSVGIGVSPNIRRSDYTTGKKKGFPLKSNIWETWKGTGREIDAQNNYIDEYLKAKDIDTRQRLQESYRLLMAGDGFNRLANTFKNQGRVNESQDAETLALYNFMNAAVQLGKTKSAFSMLNFDPSTMSDSDILEMVETTTKEEYSPETGVKELVGPYVENGRKLNTPNDIEKVKEIFKEKVQDMNNIWDSFDEAKKQVDKRFEGFNFSPEQKSTLTFMYALRNDLVHKIKESLGDISDTFNIESSTESINRRLEELKQEQSLNIAENDSETFAEKDYKILEETKKLLGQKSALEDFESLIKKDVKINPDRLSSKSLNKIIKILQNQLKLDPNNPQAQEGLAAVASLESVLNIINENSEPLEEFFKKKTKENNARMREEIDGEISDITSKSFEENIDYLTELDERLQKNNYGSDFQKDSDLYRYDTLINSLKTENPYVLASYLESNSFIEKGNIIASQMMQNNHTALGKALMELLDNIKTYNINNLIGRDLSSDIASVAEKYHLNEDEIVQLSGAVMSIVNSTNKAFENRMSYYKSLANTTISNTPIVQPEEPIETTKPEKKKEKSSVESNIVIEVEGEDIVLTEKELPKDLEVNEQEVPKEQPVIEDIKESLPDYGIHPATSEYDKQTYNDKRGSFVSPIEALDKKGLDSDTKEIITLVYNDLKDSGAFSYLNEGKLKEGDKIFYGIDSSFESKKDKISEGSIYKQPTVFIYTKNSNGEIQKVGELYTQDENRDSNRAIRALATSVYEKSQSEGISFLNEEDVPEELKEHFRVSLVTGGIIRYTEDFKSIPFNPTTAKLIYNTKYGLIANEDTLGETILIRPETLTFAKNSLFMLLPDIHGNYHPAKIGLPTLKEALQNNSDSTIIKRINDTLNKLSNIAENTEGYTSNQFKLEAGDLIKDLSEYLYLGKDTFVKAIDTNGLKKLLVGTFVRDSEGKRIKINNINSSSKVKYKIDFVAISLNKDSGNPLEGLQNALGNSLIFPKPDLLSSDSNGEYSKLFLDVAKTNIETPQLGGVFFSTGRLPEGASKRNTGVENKDYEKNEKLIESKIGNKINSVSITPSYLLKDEKRIAYNNSFLDLSIFKVDAPIEVFNRKFINPYHAFLYAKAVFFNNSEIAEEVLNTYSNADRAYFDAVLNNYDSEAWVKVLPDILDNILYAKYQTLNKSSKDLLNAINTNGYTLEYVDRNPILGTDSTMFDIEKGYTFKGKNLLGKAFNRLYNYTQKGERLPSFDFLENKVKTNPIADVSSFIENQFSTKSIDSLDNLSKFGFEDNNEENNWDKARKEVLENYKDSTIYEISPFNYFTYKQLDNKLSIEIVSLSKDKYDISSLSWLRFLKDLYPTIDIEMKENIVEVNEESYDKKVEEVNSLESENTNSEEDYEGVETEEINDSVLGEFDEGLFRGFNSTNKEPIQIQRELNWAKDSLGYRINKDIILTDTLEVAYEDIYTGNIYSRKVQGKYNNGVITISRDAFAYTLYHEAFHRIYNETLSKYDRDFLSKTISSLPEKTVKDIFGSIVDSSYLNSPEETLSELFAFYIGASEYNQHKDKRDTLLALKKLESTMTFNELVNAIENNVPIKKRTPYSIENESKLRDKNLLVKTFIKAVNLFNLRTRSLKSSNGVLSVKDLFDSINSGAFKTTATVDEKDIQKEIKDTLKNKVKNQTKPTPQQLQININSKSTNDVIKNISGNLGRGVVWGDILENLQRKISNKGDITITLSEALLALNKYRDSIDESFTDFLLDDLTSIVSSSKNNILSNLDKVEPSEIEKYIIDSLSNLISLFESKYDIKIQDIDDITINNDISEISKIKENNKEVIDEVVSKMKGIIDLYKDLKSEESKKERIKESEEIKRREEECK